MATEVQNDWVSRVLGVSSSGGDADDPEPTLETLGLEPVDLWDAAVADFRTATEVVDGQITALQKALREEFDPELDEVADMGLNAMTQNTRVPMQVALMEAGTGSLAKLKSAAPKLSKAIAAFRGVLTSDPRIILCDKDDYDCGVAISATYGPALDKLEKALSQV